MLGTRWPRLLGSRLEAKRRLLEASASNCSPCARYHSTPQALAAQDVLAVAVQPKRTVQSIFTDTNPTTPDQAAAAALFFKTHLPLKSWTATEWRKQPHTDTAFLTPEVAFLGRSNSGKSSLLNAVLLNPVLCRVGPKPGKTTTMHAWALGPHDPKTKGARKGWQGDVDPKLTVLDMPGYGHGSRGDWGQEIMKYLTTRRQLRRAFVLVNPVHGLKKQDLQMLELLRRHTIPHQLIATKCDHEAVKKLPELLFDIQSTIKSHFDLGKAGPLLMTITDILAVAGLGDGQANKRVKGDHMRGLEDVRWAILRAAGLEEYAMTLLAHGGLPPRKKSASVEEEAVEQENSSIDSQIAQLAATGQTASFSPNQPTNPEQQPATPSFAPKIGIGIDELMAMTTRKPPSESSSPKTSLQRSRPGKESQGRVRPPGLRQQPAVRAMQAGGRQRNERAGGERGSPQDIDTSRIRRSLRV